MLAEPTAAERRCSAQSRTAPTRPNCTPTNRCCRETAGQGVVELSRGPLSRQRSGHLRRDPADAADGPAPLHRHPRRPRPRRPHDRACRDDVRPPMYTPESVAAQRLLPTLDDDRVVFAGAYHGWGFHEDGAASGCGRPAASARTGRAAARRPRPWRADPGAVPTRITHLRRAPVHHYFEHHSYSWLSTSTGCRGCRRWLRPFARFDAPDTYGGAGRTLRQRHRHVSRRPRHRSARRHRSPR